MIFKVGNEILDTETTPIGLVFKTKEEAIIVANIISGIINGDSELPTEGNGNWWFMCPSGMSKQDMDSWSTLTDAQKKMLEQSPLIQPEPENQF